MLEWLREWPVKYAAVIWYVILGTLVWNFFPSHFFDLQDQIKWMEEHDKLSGWAQFYGATLALVVAILVPAWQRYLQALDKRRDDADLNLVNALGVFYLISEVRNHLEGYLEKKNMPRKLSREDDVREDLLARIHALELRDNNPERLTLLFRARGFVHQTHAALGMPYLQSRPLSPGEMSLIRTRLRDCRELLSAAEEIKDDAYFRRGRIRLWWLARLVFPLAVVALKRQGKHRPQMTQVAPQDYRDRSQPKADIKFRP